MALKNTPIGRYSILLDGKKPFFSFNSFGVDFTAHGDRDEGNACNSNINIITSNISKK